MQAWRPALQGHSFAGVLRGQWSVVCGPWSVVCRL